MVFLWPTLLWLLLAVPLLVALYAWLLHRRKQQALNYPSLGLVRAAPASACAATSRPPCFCWRWWPCCWRRRAPWR